MSASIKIMQWYQSATILRSALFSSSSLCNIKFKAVESNSERACLMHIECFSTNR